MDIHAPFNSEDPFHLQQQLLPEELAVQQKVADFAARYLAPKVRAAFRDEVFDKAIFKAMATLGLFEDNYTAVQYGLAARELERIDSGYRTVFSVTRGLFGEAIKAFGSEAQCKRYLPRIMRGDCVGCFGLTEPNHGSDPGGMETIAVKTDAGFSLTGQKRWIGLAPQADVMLIWAKDESGAIRGFLVDSQLPGVSIEAIAGKYSLRVVPSGQIKLEQVSVTADALLPKSDGLKSVFHCLNHARFGIAWGVLGAAESCYETALAYAKSRVQFDKPLAQTQLVQAKLVNMRCQISLLLQSCLQGARMIDAGQGSPVLISMLKRETTRAALAIARDARDILGGNGILDETPIIRHLLNLESVNTYEGAQDIHTLIIGRALTGVSAF